MLYHHFENTISAYVNSSFFSDNNEILKCKIIGLTCYPNETVTFMISVNGALYSELPINAFSISKEFSTKPLSYHVYSNSPSEKFIFTYIDYIIKNKFKGFIKQENKFINLDCYLGSIDFYLNNDLLHLFIGEDNFFYALPNHKILLQSTENFPKFNKQRTIWRI